MVNPSDFNELATRTARCFLGFECGQPLYDEIGPGTSNQSSNQSGNQPDNQSGNQPDNQSGNQTDKGNNTQNASDVNINIKQTVKSAMENMISQDKQRQLNENSKGPYFLIFILFLLLLGFSLDKDDE